MDRRGERVKRFDRGDSAPISEKSRPRPVDGRRKEAQRMTDPSRLALNAARRKERGDLDCERERLARLTPRERDALGPVVEGLTNKEIAAGLRLSFKTVEAHRANIMRKMEAVSVAQLVRMVVSVRPLVGRDQPCP
jgi:DNA-binding NarL/FixJ family response regulator